MTEQVRCLVADDHPAVLCAVCDYLASEEIDVVAQATNGEEALAKIATMEPTVAIVDLRMPKLSGIEIARQVSRMSSATGVIVYTGEADQVRLVEALDAGARGLVLKEAPLADLVRAIGTIAAGGTYVDPVVAGLLASAHATRKPVALTLREREVLRSLADGRTYEEIAKELFIAPATVRTHVQKAMQRLDANTRTQAVAMALRQSLIG